MFTDDQQHDAGHVRLDHVPLIYTFNLAGYRPSPCAGDRGRYTIGGFTDATFTAMAVLEDGHNAEWPFSTTGYAPDRFGPGAAPHSLVVNPGRIAWRCWKDGNHAAPDPQVVELASSLRSRRGRRRVLLAVEAAFEERRAVIVLELARDLDHRLGAHNHAGLGAVHGLHLAEAGVAREGAEDAQAQLVEKSRGS